MLHPILDVSNFNIVLTVLSLYILLYGYISLQFKQRWYLGEALPAFLVGISFGPFGAKFLNISQWGGEEAEERSEITYALTRLVIGIQLVKVGYQLPKRYIKQRSIELIICLLPLMGIGWVITSSCIMLMVPNLSFVAALIIGSCVTCTDPVLSQAIAKGPFADKYVRRHLREFISSEAGGNDGLGFTFLLLAVSLLRYAETPANTESLDEFDLVRGIPDVLSTSDVGRFGGGVGKALKHWFVEGVLYMIVVGATYGALIGFVSRKLLVLALKRKWIENESLSLVPMAIGMLVVGTCGCVGSDETLACFMAGSFLNWDGLYNSEMQARHDTFNSTLETLLNFGTFMYLGAVMPWEQFHMPHDTVITLPRLLGLGCLILLLRRIPAILLGYRFMPAVCNDWTEALFMGYFGPIGIGAISYVEYARRLFPEPGESDNEINNLTAAMTPVVYWLVFFSILVHGLSVPILNTCYKLCNVPYICDHPVEVLLLSNNEPLPNNSTANRGRHSVMVNNRFSRPPDSDNETDDGQAEDTAAILRRSEDSGGINDGRLESRNSIQMIHRAVDTRDMV
ncbi:sodium ion/proton exchanger [Aspergillus nomiae NRRL 13137]|uniref:Sodium ion/proton exchanger n=1 Tax=Aspergillus nomiae NRRL (strain ATCC 15546 / NRRL 13137 / CBS 260.88 / M93) TaxID=1509407 RepID=A0A0L1J3B3_ASPN3|nr:sodium ion/proton exchanger [Aspergillus nomiae NRRL 13137]KNG86244.1 sodium ion/proton exchanger [Aspergillus nomiae NRRL 13137]